MTTAHSCVVASRQKNRFYARIATSLGLASETGTAELIETFARFKQPKLIPPLPPRRRSSTAPGRRIGPRSTSCAGRRWRRSGRRPSGGKVLRNWAEYGYPAEE